MLTYVGMMQHVLFLKGKLHTARSKLYEQLGELAKHHFSQNSTLYTLRTPKHAQDSKNARKLRRRKNLRRAPLGAPSGRLWNRSPYDTHRQKNPARKYILCRPDPIQPRTKMFFSGTAHRSRVPTCFCLFASRLYFI